MMKRLFSLFLAVALIAVLAVPVSAAEDSGWIELLEYSSVHSNGENWFTMAGSGSVTIPLQGEKRLRKLDMLLWNPAGQRPATASVTNGGKTLELDILQVGGNLTRIVGYIPDAWYEAITVNFTKATTSSQTYEVLSCKVTPLGIQEFAASASVYIDGVSYSTAQQIVVEGNGLSETAYSQIRIDVSDWQKYDSLTIWGSCLTMGLTSVRATMGSLGLPFEMTYMQQLPTGEVQDYTYHYNYSEYTSTAGGYGNGYGDTNTAIEYNGKVIFCIMIDLTGIDRSLHENLMVYLTGVYSGLYGYTFNCQMVNGNVDTADTSQLAWWNRFTNFMSGLFGADQSNDALVDLEGSSDSITQDAADIHEFEQSQQAVLDSNFSAIQTAVTFTNFAAALTFVQRYSNMAFAGISDYSIVFTLPLFLGLFFYLCSRIPGVTRWKSRPPKAKGGDDP